MKFITSRIDLNNIAHDPFIDFLKGFAIISVVLNHVFPYYVEKPLLFCLWGEMAVPLFLIIQSFHYYKSGLDTLPKFSISKFLTRIFLPYGISQLLIILCLALKDGGFNYEILNTFLSYGGIGPGEYYIYIYVQFVILLPICAQIFKRTNKFSTVFTMVLISQLLEILCSLVQMPINIYKLSFCRYFFLIYIGYIWAREGIRIDGKRMLLSVTSVFCILLLYYSKLDLSPIVYETKWWRIFHWFCYFYPAFLLPFILRFVYNYVLTPIKNIVKYCGLKSWPIFCTQIVIFSLISPSDFSALQCIYLRYIAYAITAFSFSFIIPFTIDRIISFRKKK